MADRKPSGSPAYLATPQQFWCCFWYSSQPSGEISPTYEISKLWPKAKYEAFSLEWPWRLQVHFPPRYTWLTLLLYRSWIFNQVASSPMLVKSFSNGAVTVLYMLPPFHTAFSSLSSP